VSTITNGHKAIGLELNVQTMDVIVDDPDVRGGLWDDVEGEDGELRSVVYCAQLECSRELDQGAERLIRFVQ
jgi:hypothetical protein